MKLKKGLLTVLTGCLISLSLAPLASAAALGTRVLNVGMTGEDVKQVQTQLIQQGYSAGSVDGIYGKTTQAAVTAFQQAKMLSSDGVVGHSTLEALRGETATDVSRGKAPDRYKAVHDIVATAYAPGPEDNGQWGNLTHMGTTVRPGIIAVDPRIIPLGSRVYIKFGNGQGMYAVAEDTGGAIKGNRIDIAFQTRTEAKQFGIQNAKIFILD